MYCSRCSSFESSRRVPCRPRGWANTGVEKLRVCYMFLLGVFVKEGDAGSGRGARTVTVRYAGVSGRSGFLVAPTSGSPGELEVRSLVRELPETSGDRGPATSLSVAASALNFDVRRRLVLPRAASPTSAIALSVFRHASLPTPSPVHLDRTRTTRNPGVVYRTCTTLFESGEFVPSLTYFEHTYQYSHVYSPHLSAPSIGCYSGVNRCAVLTDACHS